MGGEAERFGLEAQGCVLVCDVDGNVADVGKGVHEFISCSLLVGLYTSDPGDGPTGELVRFAV